MTIYYVSEVFIKIELCIRTNDIIGTAKYTSKILLYVKLSGLDLDPPPPPPPPPLIPRNGMFVLFMPHFKKNYLIYYKIIILGL